MLLNKKQTKLIITIVSFVIFILFNFYNQNNKTSNNQKSSTQTKESNTTYTADANINRDKALVTKVIDGDTIEVIFEDKLQQNKTQKVRLIGINTPETVDPRRAVECFGKQASQKTKETLLNKQIILEKDPTQGDLDRYGRLLRYVFLLDNTNFNQSLIEQGYAYEYTYKTPYKYQQQFKQAQLQAENQQAGLWNNEACKGQQ